MKSTRGFTLTEILISMMLLLALGGIGLSIISSGATISQNSPTGVAYHFGRGILEADYEFVDQAIWSAANQPLSLAGAGPQGTNTTLDGVTFTANYAVTAVGGGADHRRVVMTVSWP